MNLFVVEIVIHYYISYVYFLIIIFYANSYTIYFPIQLIYYNAINKYAL